MLMTKRAILTGGLAMTLLKDTKELARTFDSFPAAKKLKELAKTPFDLAKNGNLTPERLSKFVAESAGFKFLYGTERVTEETMKALIDLAHEARALEKMEKMQAGEVMNYIAGFPSENREVLHTATRDFFNHPNKAKRAQEAALIARKETDKLKAFLAKIEGEKKFTDLIVVGIGGSDLGPRANYMALEHLKKAGKNIFFIGNIDPDTAASCLKQANLQKSLVLTISKTGTTLETTVNEEFVRDYYKKAGLKPEEHFIAITGEGSPLDDKKKYLEAFHTWDWVGGRFSTTSMIGGFLIAFACGFDVYWEFLRGASAMDKAALSKDVAHNIPLLGALLGIWNRNFLGLETLAVIPYSEALRRYPAHIQQVDMESNGKHVDQHGRFVDFQTGPIVFGEPGTSAQHSFYQLIHQGTTPVPLELIGFQKSQLENDFTYKGTTSQEKLLANLFAQAIALATGQKSDNPNKDFAGNRPSHMLLAKQLTPYALGALLAYYEHKIAFQGFVWQTNSFDQEGVQLGKVLATKIIDRFAARHDPKIKTSQAFPLGDAFINQLDSL